VRFEKLILNIRALEKKNLIYLKRKGKREKKSIFKRGTE
jgi:hypothetical protein